MHASADVGKLVLRVVLGVLILLHGISKLIHGPGFVLQVVADVGLPTVFGYAVYIGEVVAPVLLIIGLWARVGALIVVINMLFAIGLVHTGQIAMLGDAGGWALELQGMYLGAAVAVALLGAGSYSVGGTGGRWN